MSKNKDIWIKLNICPAKGKIVDGIEKW